MLGASLVGDGLGLMGGDGCGFSNYLFLQPGVFGTGTFASNYNNCQP